MKASDLFDFPESLPFSKAFLTEAPPWEWVKMIEGALQDAALRGGMHPSQIPNGFNVGPMVYLHPSVRLPSHGCILGPAYIGENCEIRPSAYIRKNVIVGNNCILGNSCEYKNSLLLENVQTPHFNYVGDSILGNNTHLGAGVILANLRFDQQEVQVRSERKIEGSGLKKLGTLLGDNAEIGCNATLMPGSIIEREAKIGPSLSFSGWLGKNLQQLR